MKTVPPNIPATFKESSKPDTSVAHFPFHEQLPTPTMDTSRPRIATSQFHLEPMARTCWF